MMTNEAEMANKYQKQIEFRDEMDKLVTKYMADREIDAQTMIGELYAEASKVSGFHSCLVYEQTKEKEKP